ncbi:glycosyltransferase family protein [Tanticharoenia sakaeratensis]|uniref:Glycosyltransferase n=1 Tax=Tanticharoenia sakaeratensis NBRC 103193 TaxID=1231623 RepID=A0A0D6MIC8_9PROT|nr:glycosyltransferase [Tanticharoenia sakaeratensis]GAN53028.1 glycosyltransferase [Tanticharoenia sakaeratensis NBRC 103193]GBQ19735.1 glycosyltransferase [Tanticharoenia sakaeratensis NBRC 103193]
MAVIYNTNYTHNPNAYLTLAVERSAKALFGAENIVVADNMSLGPLAASGEHDTLICLDAQRINLQLIRRVRPAFKTMILWTFEDPFMRDFNVENAHLFDYVFTNDPSCAEYYRGKGHYLPLAASRSIHERKVRAAGDVDYDIFFAGTMWPNRVHTLRHVIAAFPEARLKLICPGNEYLPPLPADLSALAIQRPVSHEAFIDFANASAVTLTMFRDYASHGDVSQATAPGPRFYELALAGAAQVVEAPESMESRYFDEVDGTLLARDTRGVIDHIARLLSNRSLRRKSAIAGQKSVLEQHLYDHRLQRMADITGANFGRRSREDVPLISNRRRRLRVLMCTHSTIHEQAWGGVEVYQQMLCGLLGRDVEFFYWLRRGHHCRLTTAAGREVERFDVPEVGWMDAMCDAPEEMAFSSAISQYNFDIVHFQHLGHHALSLPIIAKANGAGVVFSAHDFWLVSARYNLLNHELRYNEDEVKSVVAADITLKAAEGVEYGGEQTRRAFVALMLQSVDAILFGTKHSRDLTHEIYPLLDHKLSYVLGIPSPENTVPVARKPYEPLDGRPLRIAIVGNFLRTKGADTILSLIELAHPDHFEFHIFGYVHPEYDSVLNAGARPNVKVYGRYSVGEIEALKVADVALNLSIWPETYCISLSESWQNGLVPIVTDVGALGDRVTDGVNGFKVPIGRPSMVLERLELLRASEGIRKQMMANITPALWTSATDYGAALLDIYRDVAPRRELGVAELQFDAGQVHLLPHPSWRHQAPPRHIFDPPTTRDLAVELPEPVNDWNSVQGAECYVDDVCWHVLSDYEDEDFPGANEFHIRGWFLLPGVSSAGNLYTVLIGSGDQPMIFLNCIRELRTDLGSIFPGAPRRAGFEGQVALRGKWCEGRFRVGLINVVNGQGAFQLTKIQITVEGGKVTEIRRAQPSNGVILSDFDRVSHGDGVLRGIKLSRLSQRDLRRHPDGDLEYYIDDLSGLIGDAAEGLPEDGSIAIRGWAFLHGPQRAGQLYVACVHEERDETILFGAERLIRQDVGTFFDDAPLCAGFTARLWLGDGYARTMDGRYRLSLVNVVDDVLGMRPTDIVLDVSEGRVTSVARAPLSEQTASRIVQLLEMAGA